MRATGAPSIRVGDPRKTPIRTIFRRFQAFSLRLLMFAQLTKFRKQQARRKQAKRTSAHFPPVSSNQPPRIRTNEKVVIFLKSTHSFVSVCEIAQFYPKIPIFFLKSLQRYFLSKVYILIINILRLLLALDIVINNN